MILLLSGLARTRAARPGGVLGWLPDAVTAFDAFRRRKRTIQHLQGLDDHALADVGIARDQIESVVGEMEALVRTYRRADPLHAHANVPQWEGGG